MPLLVLIECDAHQVLQYHRLSCAAHCTDAVSSRGVVEARYTVGTSVSGVVLGRCNQVHHMLKCVRCELPAIAVPRMMPVVLCVCK
jgi:hypothetical protein